MYTTQCVGADLTKLGFKMKNKELIQNSTEYRPFSCSLGVNYTILLALFQISRDYEEIGLYCGSFQYTRAYASRDPLNSPLMCS
jgi:hypothetical protein